MASVSHECSSFLLCLTEISVHVSPARMTKWKLTPQPMIVRVCMLELNCNIWYHLPFYTYSHSRLSIRRLQSMVCLSHLGQANTVNTQKAFSYEKGIPVSAEKKRGWAWCTNIL